MDEASSPNEITEFISSLICRLMEQYIPSRTLQSHASFHPWINERVLEAIRKKHVSEGTPYYQIAVKACSQTILEEHRAYIEITKRKLQSVKPSSAKFWKISKKLLRKVDTVSPIPSLKRQDGSWARSDQEKADELADSFKAKWELPATEEINNYSLPSISEDSMSGFLLLRTRYAKTTLQNLKENSATGPDCIGTRFLRMGASELSLPFCFLCRSLVQCGY